jgi:hypothetical protein
MQRNAFTAFAWALLEFSRQHSGASELEGCNGICILKVQLPLGAAISHLIATDAAPHRLYYSPYDYD